MAKRYALRSDQNDTMMADVEVNTAPTPPSTVPDIDSPTASEASAVSSPGACRMSIRHQLRNCLSGVIYAGSFAASDMSYKVVDPGIHIKDVGDIGLPLRTQDALTILSVGSQAPFGRGTATIVDTSFRNTKELNPNQFELQNSAWTEELTNIVAKLVEKLGFADGASGVKAELYKMLLYEEGAMFKPHKDSEKANGMFGTLVICLPSVHTGGELILSHHGEEIVIDTAKASRFGQTHLAWYSDVTHEIKPVTSGYRLVLTYNLVRTGYHGPSSAETLTNERTRMQTILAEWVHQYEVGQPILKKLVYLLDHKYSTANLNFHNLKGRDALLGRMLEKVCDKEKVLVLFATMNNTVTNIREEEDDDQYDREERIDLSGIVRMNGELLMNSASLSKDEVIQDSPWDRNPDEEDREETGNEGMDITHFYRDTVIVLLPMEAMLEFQLENAGRYAINNWIDRLIESIQKYADEACRERLVEICCVASEAASQGHDRGNDYWVCESIMAKIIEACGVLQDAELLRQAANVCAITFSVRKVHKAVAGTLHCLPFSDVKPCLDQFVSNKRPLHKNMEILDDLQPKQISGTTKKDYKKLANQYQKWTAIAVERILNDSHTVTIQDVSAFLSLLVERPKKMATQHILPSLEKFVDQTSFAVAILGCMVDSKESKEFQEYGKRRYPLPPKMGRVPQDTAQMVLNRLTPLVIPALTLRDYHPKQKDPEPYWYTYEFRHLPKDEDLIFVRDIAKIYCYCLTSGREEDADRILAWLGHEIETANVRIFPAFALPLLQTLQTTLDDRKISVTTAHRKFAQHVLTLFIRRCAGPLPIRPSDWVRPGLTCKFSACKPCQSMNDFFADPEKESAEFPEDESVAHIYDRRYNYSDDNTSKFERVEHGRDKAVTRITKNNDFYQEEYKEWVSKFKGLGYKLGPLWKSGKLLDDIDEQELKRLSETPVSSPT